MAFREAGSQNVGGKFLAYGDTGTGKSSFLLTFPDVAAVDSEAGLAHYEGVEIEIDGKSYNNLKFVDDTADIDTLEENLNDLLDGEFDGKIKTFGVDSETNFYNSMQVGAMEVEERRARKTGGDVDDATVSQRQWGRIKLINMKLQQTKIDLSTKGIHVVSIAQEADMRDKKDSTKIVGDKPDMHKTAAYNYDTILHFYTKKNKDGVEEYYAEVKKDRTNVTKKGQVIQNCTFDIWSDYFNSKAKLETKKTSLRKDLDKTMNDMVDQSERVDELVGEWKATMKDLTANKKTDELKLINKEIKRLGVDIKTIGLQPLKVVEELVDFTNALV